MITNRGRDYKTGAKYYKSGQWLQIGAEHKTQFIYKYIYGKEQTELFKHELSQIEWNNIIKTLDNQSSAYQSFFDIFLKTYGKYFPKVRIRIKAKTIKNFEITKGIRKSSKTNKSFKNNFLKAYSTVWT